MLKNNYRNVIRVISICLAAAILITGCGSKNTKETNGKVNATEKGTFPIVTQPYTMKVFASQPATIEDITTNTFTKEYEKKTGIRIEWEIAMQNALQEKRQLSLASGDYPDIYFGAGVTRNEEITYGSQGVFLPLNDMIEKDSVWIKEAFEELPIAKKLVTTPNGEIYSLPTMSDVIHSKYPSKLWINTQWLKAVGISEPTTTDDFYTMLKLFKEKDPNQNGKNDEIAFFSANNNISGVVNFFINSFIQCNNQGMYIDDNDKVDVAYNKPQWQEGLKYLKKLTAEGLIDETTFAANNEQLKQIAESPMGEILGATITLAPNMIFNMGGERHKKYQPIAPLKGPRGQQNSLYSIDTGITSGNFVITKKCISPELALRWVDWFYSFEGGLETRIGKEGVNWDRASADEKSYTGEPATWKKLSIIGGAQNESWSQWNIAQYIRHSKQKGDADIYSASGLETRLYDASVKYYEPYQPKKNIPLLYIEPGDLKKILQKTNDINNYINESNVRFITGDMDIEKDWEKHISVLNDMGLKEVIEVYQKAYETYSK